MAHISSIPLLVWPQKLHALLQRNRPSMYIVELYFSLRQGKTHTCTHTHAHTYIYEECTHGDQESALDAPSQRGLGTGLLAWTNTLVLELSKSSKETSLQVIYVTFC